MIFKCAATAANYVSYVSWTCRVLSLAMNWQDDELKLCLKGLEKRTFRLGDALLRVRILLDDGWVIATVKMTDTFDLLLSVACLFWYEFLLRVQSEALVVYKGHPSWEACLPAGVPNGIWVVGSTVEFRMRTRKHRPYGSLLSRTCS